jgi:hypothetical protein
MKKILFLIMMVFFPITLFAYPNGVPLYLTDIVPACASCHSAIKAEYMPEIFHDKAKGETPEQKHFSLVLAPTMPSPYYELTQLQREKLIEEAKIIDKNTSIFLEGIPERVKKGEDIKIIVRVKGGNGPVSSVILVDKALRFQARPIQSDGWLIIGEPTIKVDGKIQNAWLDKRMPGLRKNINFITLMDQKYDFEKKIFPQADITYNLKAPSISGTYTITAAYLYGTENTSKAGFLQRPSGRILFSDEKSVIVE